MGQAASPYAATKQQCEQLLAHFVACTPGLQAMALRYFNPIGAHPSGLIGENLSNSPDNLVPVITRAASEVTGPLTVFGNDYPTPDGTCIRDFVHVCDLADAHVAALQYLMAQPCSDQSQPCHQVVNIGTGAGTSVRQLLLHFAQATGMAVPYRFGPRRPGDLTAVTAAVGKASSLLGWQAKRTLKESLHSAWCWQLKQLGAMPQAVVPA